MDAFLRALRRELPVHADWRVLLRAARRVGRWRLVPYWETDKPRRPSADEGIDLDLMHAAALGLVPRDLRGPLAPMIHVPEPDGWRYGWAASLERPGHCSSRARAYQTALLVVDPEGHAVVVRATRRTGPYRAWRPLAQGVLCHRFSWRAPYQLSCRSPDPATHLNCGAPLWFDTQLCSAQLKSLHAILLERGEPGPVEPFSPTFQGTWPHAKR